MDLLNIEKKLVPEILDSLERRYDILKYIYYNQPIGRRALSNELNISERNVRNEVNILKDNGLLNVESMGMYITEEGKALLKGLDPYIIDIKGLSILESRLEDILNIDKAYVVAGDSDLVESVLKDIGKKASKIIGSYVKDNTILGVTGGQTMAFVAHEMPSRKIADNVLVTPARGGLGKSLETQSNNIAATLAGKIGANYKLLHLPDNLDTNTLHTVLKIPVIKEVVDIIDRTDLLVFGIGRADDMAERRDLTKEQIEDLSRSGAVSESFGHYFNVDGEEIWESPTVGLSLKTFKKIPKLIGVSAGKKKAEAIMSVTSLRKDMILITDEAAAKEIIRLAEQA